MARFLLLISFFACWGGAAAAQQTGSPTATPQAEKPAQPEQAAKPAASGGYAYNPEGRRDPFVSLTQRGADPRSPASRPPGLPGLLIGEVSVKGILKDPSGYIAMIEAPDKKTYIVRSGQKLMDGSIKSITADAVVFSQDVSDPLSLVKQREIRKVVRATDRG
jgi:Tfp pilus assembly protein PilP